MLFKCIGYKDLYNANNGSRKFSFLYAYENEIQNPQFHIQDIFSLPIIMGLLL